VLLTQNMFNFKDRTDDNIWVTVAVMCNGDLDKHQIAFTTVLKGKEDTIDIIVEVSADEIINDIPRCDRRVSGALYLTERVWVFYRAESLKSWASCFIALKRLIGNMLDNILSLEQDLKEGCSKQ